MNWDAVGAIAEAIGAAGVIATLVYLARQVRQNTHTIKSNDDRLKAELAQNRAVTLANFQLAVATSPDLAAVLTKIDGYETLADGVESLEPSERAQAYRYYLGIIEHSIRTFQPYWEAFDIAGGRPGLVAAIEAATASGRSSHG